MPTTPELHAVVEVGARPNELWFELPREPWPRFVRLWRSTPNEHVALFFATASTYGRSTPEAAASIAGVLADFPRVLPGGIAVVASERTIVPSCCCGLETWREWRKVLTDGQSPWIGHDPAPLVEAHGDEIRIWSDGGMGEKPMDETAIVITRGDFTRALEAVTCDLEGFLVPLRAWLDHQAPRESAEFVSRFKDAFVQP
jgi:hypothetical protein